MSISLELLIIAGLILANAFFAAAWLLARREVREKAVSIEDIEHLIHAGTRQGVLDPAEQILRIGPCGWATARSATSCGRELRSTPWTSTPRPTR